VRARARLGVSSSAKKLPEQAGLSPMAGIQARPSIILNRPIQLAPLMKLAARATVEILSSRS
jgi:hypothetical protein